MESPWLIGPRGTKRTHDEMDVHRNPSRPRSTQSPDRQPLSTYLSSIGIGNRHSSSELTFDLPPIRTERRYPGDGFDFRRPTSTISRTSTAVEAAAQNTNSDNEMNDNNTDTQPEMEVIDLTSETDELPPVHHTFGRASRGPRFGAAEIIDLSGDSPEAPFNDSFPDEPPSRRTQAPQSPDVQFVRQRPVRQVRLPTPPVPRLPRPMQWNLEPREDFNFTINGEDDDLVFTGARVVAHPRPAIPAAAEIRRLVDGANANMNGIINRILHQTGFNIPQPRPRNRRGLPTVGGNLHFEAPDLNFGAVGFDLGLEREDTASPPIRPPPAAPAGWTRNPEEGGYYVCENCGDELSSGEDEQKRQIFVGKCGHLYCGECTQARHVTKRRKPERYEKAPKSKPFKHCVVDGCGKALSGKTAMVQLFL